MVYTHRYGIYKRACRLQAATAESVLSQAVEGQGTKFTPCNFREQSREARASKMTRSRVGTVQVVYVQRRSTRAISPLQAYTERR